MSHGAGEWTDRKQWDVCYKLICFSKLQPKCANSFLGNALLSKVQTSVRSNTIQ